MLKPMAKERGLGLGQCILPLDDHAPYVALTFRIFRFWVMALLLKSLLGGIFDNWYRYEWVREPASI